MLVGRGIVQDEDQFRGRLPRPRVHAHGIYVQAPVSALLGHYFEMSILWTHLRGRLVLAIKAPNRMAPLALFSMWILSTFLKHAPTRKNSHVPDIPTEQFPSSHFSRLGRGSILFASTHAPLRICLIYLHARGEWLLTESRKDCG